ncbi:hypothetical protein PInf_017802 [Phytophthora infestans]|nr:hypothetical protein PInf_017802 [Phytophthora infestans]
MNRSALDLHRVASDVLKQDMDRNGGAASPGQLSFSTFLMDEVSSPVQLQKVSKRPPPSPLPPLRAQGLSNVPPRRHNPPLDTSRRRGGSDGDIPVLEAARDSSGFRLDGADQTVVEVNSDDEGGAEAKVVVGEYDAEEDDFVPVLQTAEDALRAHRHMGRDATEDVREKHRIVIELLKQQLTRLKEKLLVYANRARTGAQWLAIQAGERYENLEATRTNLATGEYWASLQYYKGSNFGKLRGEMHLQDGMSVRFLEPDETKRPFCFEVAGEDFSFVCSGSNDDDASAWVCLLQSLSGGGSSTIPPSAGLLGTAAASSLLQASDGSKGNRIRTSTIDARSIRIVAELRRVLHTSKSPEAVKFKSFIGSFESRSSGALREFREFHATLTESIVKEHGARILAALKDSGNDNANGTITAAEKNKTCCRSLLIFYAQLSLVMWKKCFSCHYKAKSTLSCVVYITKKSRLLTAR